MTKPRKKKEAGTLRKTFIRLFGHKVKPKLVDTKKRLNPVINDPIPTLNVKVSHGTYCVGCGEVAREASCSNCKNFNRTYMWFKRLPMYLKFCDICNAPWEIVHDKSFETHGIIRPTCGCMGKISMCVG